MTWEETVFTEEDGALQPEFMKIQAERSFEAGIQEVVEYVESCTLVENIWEGDDWKAKKKEWGVG